MIQPFSVVIGVLTGALGLTIVSSGGASVIHLRDAVSLEGSLVTHYTFEGATTADRQQDKKGTSHLTATSFGSGNVANITYPQGFDVTTTALKPQYIGLTNGAGLFRSSYAFPSSGFTIEALVAPGPSNASDPGFVLAGPGSPNRAYPIMQREGDLKLAAGSGTFTDGSALRDIVSNYAQNDWYYLAVTFQNSGGNTIVNGYMANVTDHQTTLIQTLNNVTITGTYSTAASALGVGRSFLSQEPFNGLIDELAIYNGLLPSATLQLHLDQLYATAVPEPSSGLLAGFALLALAVSACRARRRARCLP